MPVRNIYLLSPRELSPETIAVAFAKTSRSPESFHQIAAELSDEASAKFHEKWVVGYGHASVAEHAILHIGIENVSRLAVECIESNRLGSYTEKSTRYQKWGADDFFIPPELNHKPLQKEYVRTCHLLFNTYARFLDPLRALVEKQSPRETHETHKTYDNRIRSQYIDSCRFLLPAASLANLGMTANARVLEHAIRKMLSHPLAEVQQIGEEIKRTAQVELPTLLKYANALPYLSETSEDLMQFNNQVKEHEINNKKDWCTLIDYDEDGEEKVLSAVLFRFGEMSFRDAQLKLKSMSKEEKEKLAFSILGRLDLHDIPLRELEYISYTFDLILDQGAYAEFKRHRMMTQTPQALTAWLGYALPRRIVEAGFEDSYRKAMESAAQAYEKLAAWNPHVAAYVIPNAFNRRVLFTMNLREAFHFCQLRSAANAHFSMRRVALRVAEEIQRVHPLLSRYMHLPENETWQGIQRQFFSQA